MTNARDGYLESEVFGASPPKLQLLLVEGALRAGEQAREHWHAGKNEAACELLIRAQEIVTEMTAGLNREANPGLAARLAAVYLFVFRALVEANLNHDEEKLADALRVLAIERDTWRAVCEKRKVDAPLPHFGTELDSTPSGFSLEA